LVTILIIGVLIPYFRMGTLPNGEYPLELSTLTGMLHAAGMREVGAGRA
jgi:hypothetical protein